LYSNVRAQEIKGKVLDDKTGEVLPFATVYLANTTIGTTSNADGQYTIKNVKPGKHLLSASFVGYQNATVEILMTADSTIRLDIRMRPSTMMLEEVEVVEDLAKRRRYLQLFRNEFLGFSEYGLEAKILNEEVIYFQEKMGGGLFEAFAEAPIEVENKLLGYKIYYDLVKFSLDKVNNTLFLYGSVRFEELQEKTRRRTLKNRQEVYEGSLMHFFRQIHSAEQITAYDVHPLYRTIKKKEPPTGTIVINGDTLTMAEYEKIISQRSSRIKKRPEYVDTVGPKMKKKDYVFYDADICYLKGGLYYIVFNGSSIPGYTGKGQRKYRPDSKLIINANQLRIFQDGAVDNPTALYTEGYWSWFEKVGTMLPMNYQPTE
jgi:hypothetical protein